MDAFDGEREVMNIVHGMLEARAENRSLRRLVVRQQVLLCLVAVWLVVRWMLAA